MQSGVNSICTFLFKWPNFHFQSFLLFQLIVFCIHMFHFCLFSFRNVLGCFFFNGYALIYFSVYPKHTYCKTFVRLVHEMNLFTVNSCRFCGLSFLALYVLPVWCTGSYCCSCCFSFSCHTHLPSSGVCLQAPDPLTSNKAFTGDLHSCARMALTLIQSQARCSVSLRRGDHPSF